MKFYGGMLGEQYWKTEMTTREHELLEWAIQQKPGDLYNGCDYYNHVIDQIKFEYMAVMQCIDEVTKELFGLCCEDYFTEKGMGKYENWVLSGVCFINKDGTQHVCPGGGCAVPPFTVDEIKQAFPEINCDERGLKIENKKSGLPCPDYVSHPDIDNPVDEYVKD